jgi:molybdopterin-guanine dinucleotide biosynthesis protein A
MIRNISGVILAGGACKRFNGLIKPLIAIDGKTIISRMIDAISDIFSEIIIVSNTPDQFIEYKNCRIISDHFLNMGPLGGIHSALVDTTKEAIFVFAGDMPGLDREIIAGQIDFYNANKYDIVIPSIELSIEPLHGIYKKSLAGLLGDYLKCNCDLAVREFLKIAEVQYMQMDISEKTKIAFTNINSPGDLPPVKNCQGWNE